MKDLLSKINKLSQKRLEYYFNHKGDGFYKGEETYINAIRNELEEVKDEIKKNNSVLLEDELGDVLWTYLCLLNSLEKEGFITSTDKVFERSYKKYSERIDVITGKNNGEWRDVKNKQKRDLEKEKLSSQYPGLK